MLYALIVHVGYGIIAAAADAQNLDDVAACGFGRKSSVGYVRNYRLAVVVVIVIHFRCCFS
ncbi:MAG: hypothetical protein K2M98_01915, partial [Muribaculum sp.]|nr:hypothetical protein [Muribaculum sp.]